MPPDEAPPEPSPDPGISGYLAARGYRVKVAAVGDGQFYWHAWRYGARVNGGLEESLRDASATALRACILDVTHRELARKAAQE